MPRNKDKVLAIIVCRMGSTRLKNKIFLKIQKKPIIQIIYEKLSVCKNIDKIIIATSKNKNDNKIENFAIKKKISYFRGSEKNVLKRIHDASLYYKNFNIIVRANTDCPLFMPTILDRDILRFKKSNYHLLSPFFKNVIPFGFSFVIFKLLTLKKILKLAKHKKYKEHIENFCFDNLSKFRLYPNTYKKKYMSSNLSLTLDTKNDFKKIKYIFKKLNCLNKNIKPEKIITLSKKDKILKKYNLN
jgi:spore coat polysaccharide biosynthesis protein SpsF